MRLTYEPASSPQHICVKFGCAAGRGGYARGAVGGALRGGGNAGRQRGGRNGADARAALPLPAAPYHPLSLSLSLSHAHTFIHALSPCHSLSLSHCPSQASRRPPTSSISLSLAHTHTHTHAYTRSLCLTHSHTLSQASRRPPTSSTSCSRRSASPPPRRTSPSRSRPAARGAAPSPTTLLSWAECLFRAQGLNPSPLKPQPQTLLGRIAMGQTMLVTSGFKGLQLLMGAEAFFSHPRRGPDGRALARRAGQHQF